MYVLSSCDGLHMSVCHRLQEIAALWLPSANRPGESHREGLLYVIHGVGLLYNIHCVGLLYIKHSVGLLYIIHCVELLYNMV